MEQAYYSNNFNYGEQMWLSVFTSFICSHNENDGGNYEQYTV